MSFMTTVIGSCRIAAHSIAVQVISSGRSVSYMPPGDRKSGIPAATETPAPVRIAIERHSPERMKRATEARSVSDRLIIGGKILCP